MKPFRWNLKKREQLGSLLVGERSEIYSGYLDEVRVCAAKVVARSDNRKLIFVGRSPENLFDYLSGIMAETTWDSNLDNLNISNRFNKVKTIAKTMPDKYRALKDHFEEVGISPVQLIYHKAGICFVDLVCEGFTFDRLFEFYDNWCNEEGVDKQPVLKKMRFLGITGRQKNSPNTWRWYQHAEWLESNVHISAMSISVSLQMWSHMGDYQPKMSNCNFLEKWGDDSMLDPPRDKKRLEALRTAYDIYQVSLTEKYQFVKELAKLQEYKEPWLRAISSELRRAVKK